MKRKLMTLVGTAGVLAMASMPVFAHHSFSAEFDGSKNITLDGKVSKMEWVNPHAWLYIDVVRDGKPEKWSVELGSPNVLFRNGWKKDSLPEGAHIIVKISPAKDGSMRGNSRGIEFPDGRTLDPGSSAGKNGQDVVK